ncbi:Uncharacterised protein [Afipia felis]|uniref:Uncharacterized protein n=2 Tax=Afipia felis TaxID=1035 RepID=A0A380W5E3_AFIFE|nr:hypothetical protein HMPREF9697_03805 [Afipia felis ATCC 53690]SUU76019.1 Uncharacterised protein [Afipia felis]SUU84086.1 Uncharacterised protein [Afipia felis]
MRTLAPKPGPNEILPLASTYVPRKVAGPMREFLAKTTQVDMQLLESRIGSITGYGSR